MSNPTVAVVIIGNEVLSGRTLDINTQEIAKALRGLGINLIESRTIADDKDMIVSTVRELNTKYDYIFTTGGIGPTHDDITAESIAAAFKLPYTKNQEIYDILQKHYTKLGEEITLAKEKIAYIPESAKLFYNDATMIPGFVTNNVFSLAGIPSIMKSMLKSAIPMLKKGKIIKSESIKIFVEETKIAGQLKALQRRYKNVDMGSYPFTKGGILGTSLVLCSSDYNSLNSALVELKILCQNI